MKKKISVLILFLLSVSVFAQKLELENYNWEEKIDVSNYTLSDDPIISFKEHYTEEYFFEEKQFYQASLTHKLLWLNSDDAIEEYNKIYLPFNNTSELLLSKARVIKANGEILELSSDKILTANDEETKRQYKYYAMEGIEKGCFVEFLYVIKKYASYKGSRIVLQSDYDKKNVTFELIAPKHLIFDFKSYGLSEMSKDTINKEKNKWFIKNTGIKSLKDEEMSPYDALRKSVVYKLERNLYSSGNGISSYDNFSQDLYDVYYGEIDKKDLKVVKSISKKLKLSSLSKEEAIRSIENYCKNTYYIVKSNGIRPFSEIFTNKNANEYEMMKLIIQICEFLNIQTELVITSNRYDLKFDKDFEAGNFLDSFMIYFPEVKKYTTPTRFEDRLGFPLFSYMGNYGLFIKKVTVNGFSTGIGNIKYIETLPAEESVARMDIEVDFKNDFEETNIHFVRTFSGFKAYGYQSFIDLLTDDKKNKMYDDILKMYGDEVELVSFEAKNAMSEMYGVKPLIVDGQLKYDGFISKGGNKYIFNVGGLIGPQSEMYQVGERTLPYENYFNRIYKREIKVNIPEGYKVDNIESLKMNVVYANNNEKLYGFISTYKLLENKIFININEYYNNVFIPLKDFEGFKKVINAAADFNKLNLVFVKE